MIRYSYNTQVQPPAPFVFLTVRNPADGNELQNLPAQIDLGADQTVFPEALVGALGLPQMGTIVVCGFRGATYTLPTKAVFLRIHDLPLQPVKVIGVANEPWVLLGRDVVNAHRLVLDGPQLALEIG